MPASPVPKQPSPVSGFSSLGPEEIEKLAWLLNAGKHDIEETSVSRSHASGPAAANLRRLPLTRANIQKLNGGHGDNRSDTSFNGELTAGMLYEHQLLLSGKNPEHVAIQRAVHEHLCNLNGGRVPPRPSRQKP